MYLHSTSETRQQEGTTSEMLLKKSCQARSLCSAYTLSRRQRNLDGDLNPKLTLRRKARDGGDEKKMDCLGH